MIRPNVAPRYSTARSSAPSMGAKVDKLAAAMGLPLMPWQRHVAEVGLELDERGLYRYSTVLLTVPRQSGKTSLLRAVLAHRALTRPRAELWVTAQLRNDARDLWADTCDLIEASPLGQLTKRRNSNGSECLTFSNGSRLRLFNAGSDKALHGRQSDLVFIDEAFSFTAEQGAQILQAVVPTQATRPGAQTWIVSTAGTASSTWLREFVTRGREGGHKRLAYFEWSIPEDTEDLSDLQVYAAHHPALGHTIGPEALETAFETMGASEFARAYGNFWTSAAEYAIPPAVWAAALSQDDIDRRKPVAFGIEVAADRSGGVITVCGHTPAGMPLVDVIEYRGGIGWIAPRVLELAGAYPRATVVVDPVSPAGPVHRELVEHKRRRNRVPLAEFSAAELVIAHTEFLDALTNKRLTHTGHPRLDAALSATTLRPLRETEVFSRRIADDGGSPAALIAAVLAHHGVLHPVTQDAPRIHVVTG